MRETGHQVLTLIRVNIIWDGSFILNREYAEQLHDSTTFQVFPVSVEYIRIVCAGKSLFSLLSLFCLGHL